MARLPDSLKPLSEDGSLHFVQWLTTCTRQHFARWQVCSDRMRTFIAGAHGPMLIQFVMNSAPQDTHNWRLFTITSPSGIELLHATRPANAQIGPLFASAIDVLFQTVSKYTFSPLFILRG